MSILPDSMRLTAQLIKQDPRLNDGVKAMESRRKAGNSGLSPSTALLAGIAMNRAARGVLNQSLDQYWDKRSPRGLEIHDEVIIGGGLHAAVYCAARAQLNKPQPLVIEQGTVGGSFAMSLDRSVFYLNSRNRPGPLSLPGDGGALNFIPGAPVQPSHLSNEEFQRNDDLAYCIRVTLAMYADVMRGEVTEAEQVVLTDKGQVMAGVWRLRLASGQDVFAKRAINARGAGTPKTVVPQSKHVLTYNDFMSRMGQDKFPLRGMDKVAVVGDGDSGKTVVEAIVGQGPPGHMSAAALDYPTVDWYGNNLQSSCLEAAQIFRSRYKRLAGLFPQAAGQQTRIRPIPAPGRVRRGLDCAYVNSQPYDHVIVCVGLEKVKGFFPGGTTNQPFLADDVTTIGFGTEDKTVIRIGANRPPGFADQEPARIRQLSENKIAAFRLVPFTATMAMMLP